MTCILQGLIDEVGQANCRKLACWLTREAKAGRGGAQDFCPGIEGLENGVPSYLGDH